MDTRKKLQPIVNKYIEEGAKAYLRGEEIIVNGTKLSAEQIGNELHLLNIGKRSRSRSPSGGNKLFKTQEGLPGVFSSEVQLEIQGTNMEINDGTVQAIE